MTIRIAPASVSQTDAADSSTNNPATSGSKALGDEKIFLQLLVAQIKNQDPTKPVDSTQFMTQLAQFSNLEQLIGLNTTVTKIGTAVGVPPDTTQTNDTGGASS